MGFSEYSQLIQAVVTFILVCITGWYAYSTYKIHRIMEVQQKLIEKQVLADIQLSNISLKCKYNEAAEERNGVQTPFFWLRFDLSFDIYNRSSANGSIDMPTLVFILPHESQIFKMPPTNREVIFITGGEKRNGIKNTYDSKRNDSSLVQNISSLDFNINFTDNLGNNRRAKVDKVVLDSNSFGRAGISV